MGRLPAILIEAIKGGHVSLEKVDTTLELLRADAVVGVKAHFDGKTLTNWQPTKFTGEGAVKVEDGQVILEAGRPTGFVRLQVMLDCVIGRLVAVDRPRGG